MQQSHNPLFDVFVIFVKSCLKIFYCRLILALSLWYYDGMCDKIYKNSDIMRLKRDYSLLLSGKKYDPAVEKFYRFILRHIFFGHTYMPAVTYEDLVWGLQQLWIKPQKGPAGPFILTRPQHKMLHQIFTEQMKPYKNRILVYILKSRQWGGSTATEMLIYARSNWGYPGQDSRVISYADDQANHLFNMFSLAYDHDDLKRPLRKGPRSTWKMHFSDLYKGEIEIASAWKGLPATGFTVNNLHVSEIDKYRNPSEAMASFDPAVPNNPECMLVIESTAEQKKCLYGLWQTPNPRATKVFVGWLEDHTNTLQISPTEKIEILTSLTEDEKRLSEQGATPENLAFRRDKLAGRFSVETFKQEYPTTPEEAFQFSASGVFEAATISHYDAMVDSFNKHHSAEYWRGEIAIARDPDKFRVYRPHYTTHSNGRLQAFKRPIKGHSYALAIDPAQGIEIVSSTSRTERDNSCIQVWDYAGSPHSLLPPHPELVNMWLGKCDTDELAYIADSLARKYNMANVICDITGAGNGRSVLQRLVGRLESYGPRPVSQDDYLCLNYPRHLVYQHKISVDGQQKFANVAGFNTSPADRKAILITLHEYAREHRLYIYAQEVVSEMNSFVRDKNGKWIAMSGAHDDTILTAAMALHAILHMLPRSERPAYEEHREKILQRDLDKLHNLKKGHAHAGWNVV